MSLFRMECLYGLADGAVKKGIVAMVLTAYPLYIFHVIATDIIISWHEFEGSEEKKG